MESEEMTVQELRDLQPKWREYLELGGNPPVGTERYIDLMQTFFFIEGKLKGLDRAKQIYSSTTVTT